ncbi:MAG TPA: hypothetical protein VGF69_00585 [Thermoanaerobaculia bacterium]|jgi:hypothetical protein
MIRKSESDAARHPLPQQRPYVEPPTDKELLAYANGELSPDQAARVREALAHYPDLAQALTQPFPEAPQPGDPDYLSPEVLTTHWEQLEKEIHGDARRRDQGKVLQFWRASALLAAMLTVVFGSLLWRARSELAEPRGGQIVQLQQMRGDAGANVASADDVLTVSLKGLGENETYRLTLEDAGGKTVSRGPAVPRPASERLGLVVPRKLRPGTYTVVVYAVFPNLDEQDLQRYPVRVVAR